MNPPSLSVVLTLNNRPIEAMRRVFESFHDQSFDEMIIVLDQPEDHIEPYARGFWRKDPRVKFVRIDREPGWICPARAWNTGFARVSSEVVYCISSEVIQEPGNVEKAKEILTGPPAVVFGRCVDDGDIPIVSGPHPQLLCGTEQPRPLGFIWAMPTWTIRIIGGYDEDFMDGIAFEDDDITWRLWRLGLPFLFTDEINGVHQHHDRPFLNPKGVAQDNINERLIIRKWGHAHPWAQAKKLVAKDKENGRLICFPCEAPGLNEVWGIGTQDA